MKNVCSTSLERSLRSLVHKTLDVFLRGCVGVLVAFILCAQVYSNDALTEAEQAGRAFSLVYDREDWKHWSDFDGNCINTRHEILKAQAINFRLSPDGCFVSVGLWNDPFSGKQYTRPSDLDVDHVVPLFWAHSHGGANWSRAAKELFANDRLNLLAVDDGLNQAKGASSPGQWMPPNKQFHCNYLVIWHRVLAKYPDLKMTDDEARDFNGLASDC